MNKNLKIGSVFIAGVLCAMIYNYSYNSNGRFVPITSKYSNVNIAILDTRTGRIFFEVTDSNGKTSLQKVNMQSTK